MKKLFLAGIAALFLATGTAHADENAIEACFKRFAAGELQPGDEIGACYAKATNNKCDGSLDGSSKQVCTDWVDEHPKTQSKSKPTADQEKPNWEINCRRTEIQYIGDDEYASRHLTLKDIREIEKLVPYLKKCDAFWQCVVKRGIKWPEGSAFAGTWVNPPGVPKPGAPKHCYPPRGPDGKRLNT
jgi:hypothetical protein